MISSSAVSYLSFSSASREHLSSNAYQSVKDNLVQEISKIVGISFTDPDDFSLEGKTLGVLEKSGSTTIGIPLTETQAKKVGRVLAHSIGFIRNTGDFEYGSKHRKKAVLSLIPPADSFGTSLEKFIVGPLNKGLSFCKDALTGISLQVGSSLFARSLGGAVGIIDLGAGIVEFREAEKEKEEADQLNDREGYQRAEAKMVQSELQLAAGSLFFGQSIWTFAAPGMAEIAAVSCTPLFFLLMTIGAVIGVALPIFGIQRCKTFLGNLDEYLENPHLTEEQQIAGALRYLQEQISLSPEEEAALPREAIEREKAIQGLLENKLRHVKRRTSLKSLLLIANTSKELLRQIADPTEREGGIKQARELIGQIKWASYCKIALNILSIIAMVVGFAALIAGFILTGGSLPLILGLAAGALCLGLSAYGWAGSKFYRLSDQEMNAQILK